MSLGFILCLDCTSLLRRLPHGFFTASARRDEVGHVYQSCVYGLFSMETWAHIS